MDEVFRQYADRVAYSFMGRTSALRRPMRSAVRLPPTCKAWAWSGRPRGHHDAQRAPVPRGGGRLLRAGFVVVNVNPLYTPRELEHQLKDSGSKAIVIIENFATTLQSCIANTPVKHVVLCAMGDQLGFLWGMLVNYVVRNVKKLVPESACPAPCASTTPLPKGQRGTFKPVDIKPDDIALLQYTGGTTGVARARCCCTAT